MTSKKERLEASIKGTIIDRPPVALWRHFPVDDQKPDQLAKSISEFQNRYDFDFVKVTPASSYCLMDWGVEDRWEGSSEGTRSYTKRVINQASDWEKLELLDPQRGHLAAQLQCLKQLREDLGEDTPIIQTIFNPLSQAKNLAGEARLLEHLHREPSQVESGLQVIMASTVAFIEALGEVGIDGVFFATQHATFKTFDTSGYARFGEKYDLPILEASDGWWLNILHLHGEALMFDLVERYPVQVVNWHDLETDPDLVTGSKKFKGAVCGGVRRSTLTLGTPEEVTTEAEDALRTMKAGGLILSTGCVVPITAPSGNIHRVRDAVDFA